MTHDLAAALLRDVKLYEPDWAKEPYDRSEMVESTVGRWLDRDEVLTALTLALDPALTERAERISTECLQAAEVMQDTNTFQTGQAIFLDASDMLTALLAQNAALRAEGERYLRHLTAGAESLNAYKARAEAAETALAAMTKERDYADGTNEVLRGENQRLETLLTDAEAKVEKLRGAGKTVLHDIDELVANSEGVAGLHMNGEVAEWSSLMDGGAFGAWLSSVEGLRAALTTEADNG